MLYDVFICHSSEDKEEFVRPLADALRARHIEVWFDEFTLKLGDSIRRSIDRGLAQSRFGIVVFSPAFFAKEWPQYELDGLADREMSGRVKVILPIWHRVSHDDVAAYSPALAGRRAVPSGDLNRVVQEIAGVVRPAESPLVIARDEVIEWGGDPPVVTDSRWLEAVEAANRLPGYGMTIPEHSSWRRWAFPLPSPSSKPARWGERLAWAYMQLDWTEAADRESISPLTPPDVLHEFIERFPGLHETCETYPSLLVEYAPQLSVRGFEGSLKNAIIKGYRRSCAEARHIIQPKRACEEEWALRHPTLGGFHVADIAGAYFDGGMFGPEVSPFEHADHLVWLLSGSSDWLPRPVHKILLDGQAAYPAWEWRESGFPDRGDWPNCGALSDALKDAIERRKRFRWTAAAEYDLRERVQRSRTVLGLVESVDQLIERFAEAGVLEKHIDYGREIRRRPRRRAA